MTTDPFPKRRTRSQIRLSDDIFKHTEHSPMKYARNVARENPESHSLTEKVNKDKDESLPTLPRPSGSKRSVSPLPNDEHGTGVGGNIHGRSSKRMKLQKQEIQSPVNICTTKLDHSRTSSEPNIASNRKAQCRRAGTTMASNKPNSMSSISEIDTLAEEPDKSRAWSVPLFPSSSSLPSVSSFPILDLRNPPMSPIHSHSPSHAIDRLPRLKVHPITPELLASEQPSKASHDETRVPIDMNNKSEARLVIESFTRMEDVYEPATPKMLPEELPKVSIYPPESPTPAVPLHVPVSNPATPAPSAPSFLPPMSPLTPLPETPLLPREGGSRTITKESRSFGAKEGYEVEPSLHSIPQPNFGELKNTFDTPVASQSQIPRNGGPLPPFPVLIRSDSGGATGKPFKSTREDSDSVPIRNTKSCTRLNAIQLFMQNASKQRTSWQQDEGKNTSQLPKTISSTGSIAKGRGKVESGVNKPSLEDKTRLNQNKGAEISSKFVPQATNDDKLLDEKKTEVYALIPPISEMRECLLSSSTELETRDQSVISPLCLQRDLPVSGPSKIVGNVDSVPTLPKTSSSSSDIESNFDTNHDHINMEPPLVRDHSIVGKKEEVMDIHGVTEPVLSHDPQGREEISATVTSTASQVVENSKRVEILVPSVLDVDSLQADKPKLASKKRKQSGIPTSMRVTRSALKPPSELGPSKPTHRMRANSVGGGKSFLGGQKPSLGKRPSKESDDPSIPQGSPMQKSSPIQRPRTPRSSPAKISLTKTPSKSAFTADSVENSPSPAKIAKAVSMFNHSVDVFAMDDIGVKPNSSLSTLSTALKKLEMPAPSRPNTSLGFNHDASCDDNEVILPETVDKPGLRNSNSLKRSFTVGHAGTRTTSSDTLLSQMAPSTKKPRLVQKPMTMFFAKSGSSSASTSTLSNSFSTEKTVFGGVRSSLIGPGFKDKGKTLFKGLGNRNGLMFPATNKRLVQKVSRKTTLPTVEASPVKGGSNNVLSGSVGNENEILDGFPLTSGSGGLEEITAADSMNNMSSQPSSEENAEVHASGSIDGKRSGKEKEKPKPKDSSRRASMALSQLSESLCTTSSSSYNPKVKVIMGPPATPRKVARSVSSTYPGPSKFVSEEPTAGTNITTATSSMSPSGSGGKRSSARQAAKAALNAETKSPSMSAGFFGPAQKGGTDKEKLSARKTESWGVLKDCKIFVDVRTDDGEEAGSLFMEMLENLGAKIQTRVGQACTHVIFKNGLMSTISRYRLLREPKPSVVGIAWVVECVEQRSHVDETPFLIDLSEMNIAGTNKRRRSMLPKLISSSLVDSAATDVEPEGGGDGDISMDSSQSSTVQGDDLTPLERARRRRSMIFGPTA